MRIAILGAGPAGLFAAHAANELGCQVDILSKNRQSFMRGAQYLHRPIPGLSGDPFQIDYRLDGSIDLYRTKVYGPDSGVDVSPETLVGLHQAWDIREAYNNAWDEYEGDITDWRFGGSGHLGFDKDEYDLIISTIPAHLLCSQLGQDGHEFVSQNVWSTDFVKHMGPFGGKELQDNIVVCSGKIEDWWYRASRIHGWENTEYPFYAKPTTDRVWKVEKPLWTSCTCHPDILRIGRYGQWTKGVLSDSAYYDVQSAIVQNLEARIP